MDSYVLRDARIVNEGSIIDGDILIKNGRIERIGGKIDVQEKVMDVDTSEKYVIPGIIDDQVHFREPGLTEKASIYTEAKAAVAGGVTSFMEMPNTKPPALTQTLLEDKYQIGSGNSMANYSFFMGVSNDNYEEVMQTDRKKVCGLKIFMGSSTGNMLVDDDIALNKIFGATPLLIATHCEDEGIIRANEESFRNEYGEDVPIKLHHEIRTVEACIKSSSKAIELAKQHGTRLHILHITTMDETQLFDSETPLENKMITSEVCVHHLWFDSDEYEHLGGLIKCNPAIKDGHRDALFEAMLNNNLDIIATDHAPHERASKDNTYFKCPSGIPLIQHSLSMMVEFFHQGRISLERIVEKMCHAPAICFKVEERGFIREGYHADIVLIDIDDPWKVEPANLHYKCGWSPFEDVYFSTKVVKTFVNGHLAYDMGKFDESQKGSRLSFNR